MFRAHLFSVEFRLTLSVPEFDMRGFLTHYSFATEPKVLPTAIETFGSLIDVSAVLNPSEERT